MTLIEVIAATVLLGTLLVAAVSGFSANRRQLLRAAAKESALAAMDQLMADWFAKSDWRELPFTGRCPEAPDLTWKATRLRPETIGDAWPVYAIRIEIFSGLEDRKPLTTLEILAADEPGPTGTGSPGGLGRGQPR